MEINSLIRAFNSNKITSLYVSDVNLILRQSNNIFHYILDAIIRNNSLINIHFIIRNLNNKKIVQLINALKDIRTIKKIYVIINSNSKCEFINILTKLNRCKIIFEVSVKNLSTNDNFKKFIQQKILYKYICNTTDINDFEYIVNNSGVKSIVLSKPSNNNAKKIFSILSKLSINKLKVKIKNYNLNEDFINYLAYYISLNKPLYKFKLFNKLNKDDLLISYFKIIDALKYNTQIKILSLQDLYNINVFSKVFEYNKSIETLQVYTKFIYFKINHEHDNIDDIIKSLQNNTSLKNIYINTKLNSYKEHNYNGFYNINNHSFFNELFLKNKTLQTIKMCNCGINNIDGLIENLKSKSSLKNINLSYNNITNINILFEVLNINKSLQNFSFYVKNIYY